MVRDLLKLNLSSEANYFDLDDDNKVAVEDYINKVEELPRPMSTKKANAIAKYKGKAKSSQLNEVVGR